MPDPFESERDEPRNEPEDELRLAAVVLGPDGLPTIAAPPREHYAALVVDRFVCLACRWYMDMLTPSGDTGPDSEGPRKLQRWCLRHGDLELTDAEIYACSRFFPRRWWSLEGWLRWRQCRRMVQEARDLIYQRTVENARARETEDGYDYGSFVVSSDPED